LLVWEVAAEAEAVVGVAMIVLSDLQNGEKRFFVHTDASNRSYHLYSLVVGLPVNATGFLGLRKILERRNP